MISWRGGPRSGSARHRSGPDQDIPPWDDSSGPLDDPRAPPDLRGPSRSGPSRRSGVSSPLSGSRGRGPSRRESDVRRGPGQFAPPPNYTDEEPALGYDDDAPEGYSEEYEARPRYADNRRGPASGVRGPRSTPGASRAPGRRPDSERGGYGYGAPEDYGRPDGYGRPAARSGRDPRDVEPSGYTDYGTAYPPTPWGGPVGQNPRDAYEESSVWAPGGQRGDPWGAQAAGGARGVSGVKAPAKAPAKQSGVFALAFRLLTVVMVVVGLVTVVGPELAPKLGKYLPFLRSGAQATPPAFATYTPGPTPTSLPNYKLFVSKTSAYAMDYPATWGTSAAVGAGGAQSDNVDQFAQPGGPAEVNVERAQSFASATDAQIIQAELQSAQDTTFTEITGAATTEGVGGEVWQRKEYQAVAKNGAKRHIAVLACHHLGAGYVLVLISSDTGFANQDTTVFEPMLRSFRFL